MMTEFDKIVKDLNEKGWSKVMHYCFGEEPDSNFLLGVWKSFNEKNLWLYYDWQIAAIRSDKSEPSHYGKFWKTDAIGKTCFQNSE